MMTKRNILLIEPGYKNKYPPLGLMKIAQYHGPLGKRDNVNFIKGQDSTVLDCQWDRVYVGTLFTFEWKRIEAAIDFALNVANGQADRVFVGGIAASLMPEEFLAVPRWTGIRFIQGLLDKAPAVSLQLDNFAGELYSDDQTGKPIEDLVPDYSILDQIEYQYPVNDAYFGYASRGCIRKCKFCGVPKLEGSQRDAPPISDIVNHIEALYGTKKDLILMDNNVVASPRFKEIIAEIRDLGFTAGARLHRGRVPVQRRVDFNQGVDARILCKDSAYLRELATICLKPLRIAFDHMGLKNPYEKSIRIAHEFGLSELSNYMLYNFHDTPSDLFARMRLNVQLNEELGVRIWSFPMRYQPTNLKDRSHVGNNWNRYMLRSMQIVLQATHGVVSGAPDFFRVAFGDTEDEFMEILSRPHHFIFNRIWYEQLEGRSELAEYEATIRKLSLSQRRELLDLLSNYDPSKYTGVLEGGTVDPALQATMAFHVPLSKDKERRIWTRQAELLGEKRAGVTLVPDDERVEDAGLDDDVVSPVSALQYLSRGGKVHLIGTAE